MKKSFVLFLLATMFLAGQAFAAEDSWNSYGMGDSNTQTEEDKKAVARNIAALAKNPEALKAAANIAKIRMKQREQAAQGNTY